MPSPSKGDEAGGDRKPERRNGGTAAVTKVGVNTHFQPQISNSSNETEHVLCVHFDVDRSTYTARIAD